MTQRVQLTGWFPAEIKPHYPGVYQTEVIFMEGDFSYWDGRCWYCSADTVEDAEYLYKVRLLVGVTEKVWRGLANPLKVTL